MAMDFLSWELCLLHRSLLLTAEHEASRVPVTRPTILTALLARHGRLSYSAERASHERKADRFRSDLRQSRIHHTHGQAEHRDLGGDISRAMPFKTGNGRQQTGNHTEDQAMGIAPPGLGK